MNFPVNQCPYCDKTYKYIGDLNKHLREHLGENIYKCKECPAEFKRPLDLRKHSFDHYKNSNAAASETNEKSMGTEKT